MIFVNMQNKLFYLNTDINYILSYLQIVLSSMSFACILYCYQSDTITKMLFLWKKGNNLYYRALVIHGILSFIWYFTYTCLITTYNVLIVFKSPDSSGIYTIKLLFLGELEELIDPHVWSVDLSQKCKAIHRRKCALFNKWCGVVLKQLGFSMQVN